MPNNLTVDSEGLRVAANVSASIAAELASSVGGTVGTHHSSVGIVAMDEAINAARLRQSRYMSGAALTITKASALYDETDDAAGDLITETV